MGQYFSRYFKIFLALAVSLGGVRGFVVPAQAATITDIFDQPSSLTVSTASNHKLTFTLTSAANESSTISLTFPSAFDTSAITEDDVDIADDGVDLSTAPDCGGSEQISVSIVSDIVTITVCAGDGGSIAAGSIVVLEIGVNASSSGTGTQRISNPATVGTHMITLGGSFGDRGSVPLPIVSGAGTSGVTGTISAPSAPSSGGDSPPAPIDPEPDPTPDPELDPDPDPTPDPEPDPVVIDPDPAPDSGDDTSELPDSSDGGGEDDVPSGDTSGGDTLLETPAAEIVEEPSVEIGPIVARMDLIAPGSVILLPRGDTYSALPETLATVRVEVDGEAASVALLVEGEEYILLPAEDGVYSGTIVIPRIDALVVVVVTDPAGLVTRETYYLDVRNSGLLYEMIDERRVPVGGAVVTIYAIVDGARVAYAGTENPSVLGNTGIMTWYVPNGAYIVTAGKYGFDDGTSEVIIVKDNILAPSFLLIRTPSVVVPVVPGMDTVVPVLPNETATVTLGVGEVLAAIRNAPVVQVAADIAVPAVVAITGASIVLLASSFSLWPFLQYLITSPILFFARRKRKAFGTVYSAATKLPIDLAIIRLFSLPDRKLLRTAVSDAKGKYLFAVAPGRYALEVIKPNFAFPSVISGGGKDDGVYLDVYSGQEIVVSEQEALIAANIPLDPAVPVMQDARAAVARRFLRVLQSVAAVIGVGLAVLVFIISPSWFTGAMCLVQIVVYALVRRLAVPRRPKGWGIVYDGNTRLPVGNTVVRLFEPTYNKLIETVITDRLGRYAFLVGPNEYYVTYAKPGYVEKIVRPLDFRAIAEPSTVAVDTSIDEMKEHDV